MAKNVLGKGLEALLMQDDEQNIQPLDATVKGSALLVDVSLLKPNPQQPRSDFSEDTLQELAESIREHGIIQPILAEEAGDGTYYIIAGERRTRAARIAGLTEVPVIIKKYSNELKLEVALIENIQRENLNPVEEARAYHKLMEMSNLTQEEISVRVGKNRATVANALRLLKLPEDMLNSLSSGQISAGHARALLSIMNPADQRVMFGRIVGSGMSVREAERDAGELNKGSRASSVEKKVLPENRKDPQILSIEQQLIDILGTKVVLKGSIEKGSIQIEYFSRDDLDRLYSFFTS